MAKIKLTKRNVDRLPAPDPSGRQTLHWAEGEFRGLGILVSGVTPAKSWIIQTKVNGKTRRVTLGPTHVLSIEDAWERAKPELALMYAGRDPKVSAGRRKRAAMTLAEVLDDYLAASPNLAATSVKMYRATARDHLAPFLGRTLREISAEEVRERFDAITREIVARGRRGVNVDGRATANLTMILLRSLFNHQAERDPDMPPNPVGRAIRPRTWHRLDRRTRHVPADRLAEFYAAAKRLASPIQRDLVILALFTGMRSTEASALRWDEVDLAGRMIRLPSGRMKAHRAFELPTSDVVHRLLVARRAIGHDGDHVFPGNGRSGSSMAFAYALRQIAEMTGIVVSPHDLRRTFASVAAVTEVPPLALKLMLAHSTGSDITFGYTQLAPADLRAAVQKVSDRMKQLCGMEAPAGNVVNL